MNHYNSHDVEKGAATQQQQTFDNANGSHFHKADRDGADSIVSHHNAVPARASKSATAGTQKHSVWPASSRSSSEASSACPKTSAPMRVSRLC
jgi:hypothetical protein